MASYVTPKKGVEFIFYAALIDQSDTRKFKSSPTLASGDFKVSIDGGALANLATLPTNTPSGVMVKFTLSTSEMNGDNITVVCIDAAGAEWCDVVFNIQTSARQVDDLAWPTTTGRSMDVDASGGVEVGSFQANALTDAGVAADLDVYTAKVWLIDDNSGATDLYMVVWYLNGAPVAAGSITTPLINVFKAADGSNLIASTAMTQITSQDAYKYAAVTTERVTSGAGYVAKVTATIGGSARTWMQPVGRDS